MSKPGDPNLHLHKVKILIGVGGSLPNTLCAFKSLRKGEKERKKKNPLGRFKTCNFFVIECGKVT